DRVIGEIVGGEAVAANEVAVVLQRRAEVVAPVARAEAVVIVEAAVVGVIGRLQAVVPFAISCGSIAGRFERLGDRLFVKIEPLLSRGNAPHAAAGVITA